MYVPENPTRALSIAESLTLVGFVLVLFQPAVFCHRGPGAQFMLSMIANVIAVGIALPCLRVRSAWVKAEAYVVICVATGVMVLAMMSVRW